MTLIGHRWDTACGNLRRFLARNQISFNWLTPDAPELSTFWPGTRPPADDGPVVRLADGAVIERPEVRDLANRLGLQTRARAAEYDVAIVGGGPAGLAAAVYGASEGLRTIVVEREAPGGQAGTSSRIENYLGFPSGISGDELASRALQQARRLGAEILVTRSVARIDPTMRAVFLDGDEVVRASTFILATGVTWRRLAIDGFDRLIGKGVYYGADAWAGRLSRRRRELGWSGGPAFCQPRAQGDPCGPRGVTGRQHVSLFDRTAPRKIACSDPTAVGNPCGPRRHQSYGDRHSRQGKRRGASA